MNRTISGVVIGMVLVACGGDEPLEAGDCPGTPTELSIDPVAPFYNGLLALEFQAGGVPGSAEIQRFSPSRSLWEPTYGPLSQRDDGTYVVVIRPQTSEADNEADYKLRVRTTLQGCAPSEWAETEAVTLGDPVKGTTWLGEFDRTAQSAQINVSVSSGTGTSAGPYRLSTTAPLRHRMTFGSDGKLAETFEVAFESANPGDLYNGCRFVLAFEGSWVSDYDYDRLFVFSRTFKSMTGSTCANPPIADIPLTEFRIPDDSLSLSNIDYSRLIESPAGTARWSNYGPLQNSISTFISVLSDNVGPDTSSIDGYVNVFNPIYEQQP